MRKSYVIGVLLAAMLLVGWSADASAAPPKKNPDMKAKQQLARGLELLEGSQDERAVKLLSSIPRLFPKSAVRFDAYLALGKHFMEKSQYERAIAQFNTIKGCENTDLSADALYQMGICYFHMNKYDNSFAALRKVTNQYAGSVYANESFYYIGQCHFKLGRWAKAVEALQRVGTSVSSKAEDRQDVTAEAGQELFFKVLDKDLVVLNKAGKISAKLVVNSGDTETIELKTLGKDPSQYIGKIPTKLGKPSAGDNVLQIIGGDSVSATYMDENTAAGQRNQKVLAVVRMVSTAAAGFTNGAYSEYVEGVIGNTESFLRVKDMDRDVTHNKDTVQVTISTRYKVRQEAADAVASDATDYANEQKREVWKTRDSVTVTLNETEEHTGVFTGKTVPRIVNDPTGIDPGDKTLSAMKGDEMVCMYVDNRHMGGEDPVEVKGTTKVFIGKPNDVAIRHWLVDDPEQKARKNLIEAKIYLKLAGIFKDVGLMSKAKVKAEQGVKRVDLVIRTGLKASMDRSIIEEAFMVKWELRLVQGNLGQAIGVCRTLMRLFPDSTLVDRAMLKIGQAKMQGGDHGGAITIFSSICGLKQSTLKAEAQYMIAQSYETRIRESNAKAIASGRKVDVAASMGRAVKAYQKCAENYPDSAFAGPSLEKVANFYLLTKDFARAGELMERVVQDYPDASFLDRMLLNWAKAAQGMGDSATAKAKCEQLMSEYPASELASEAMAIIKAGGAKPAPEPSSTE